MEWFIDVKHSQLLTTGFIVFNRMYIFISIQVGWVIFHVKALPTGMVIRNINSELDVYVHVFLLKLCIKHFVLATRK